MLHESMVKIWKEEIGYSSKERGEKFPHVITKRDNIHIFLLFFQAMIF